jgi:uncharacterized protein (DUF433 family)
MKRPEETKAQESVKKNASQAPAVGSREVKEDPMTVTDRIEINSKIMMGKPVIRNTRIPVDLILRKMSEGASTKDLLAAYPKLTPADIKAAVRYAADIVAHEETVIIRPLRKSASK